MCPQAAWLIEGNKMTGENGCGCFTLEEATKIPPALKSRCCMIISTSALMKDLVTCDLCSAH